MTYILKVTKTEDNPDFPKEIKEFNTRSMYDGNHSRPDREFIKNILEGTLTEDEYKKVKAEVIKVFE